MKEEPHAPALVPVILLAVLQCLPSCDSNPPAVEVTMTREVGPVRFKEIIRVRDGGYSALFAGRSVPDMAMFFLHAYGGDPDELANLGQKALVNERKPPLLR